jgi:VIT1/CCC1 family predicted Fe2+/Mn2+ transporter
MQVQFNESHPYRSKKENKMNTYRKNAVMTGILYFLGTVFGVLCYVVGGEVLSSISTGKSLAGVDILGLVAANSSRLTGGAFLTS